MRTQGMRKSYYFCAACFITAIIGAMYGFTGIPGDPAQNAVARTIFYVAGAIFLLLIAWNFRAFFIRGKK